MQDASESIPKMIQEAFALLNGDEGTLARAEALCRRVLELDPENANARLAQAIVALRAKRFDDCIGICDDILARSPGQSTVNNVAGCAYSESGRHEQARDRFIAALATQPSNANVLRNLAATESNLGNFESALQHARKVVELTRQEGPSRLLPLADLQLKAGMVLDAIQTLRLAAKESGGDHKILRDLAVLQQQVGQVREAEASCLRAIESSPRSLEARKALAVLLSRQGRHQQALDQYRVIEAAEDGPSLEGDYEQAMCTVARQAAERAKSLAPLFIIGGAAPVAATVLANAMTASSRPVVFRDVPDLATRLPRCIEFAASKAHIGEATAGNLEEVMRDWRVAGFFPGSGPAYLDDMLDAFYSLVALHDQEAGAAGNRWSVLVTEPAEIAMLRTLLPSAKFIFVHQSLFDIARVYKAQDRLEGEYDLMALARDWKSSIEKAWCAGDRNVLVVRIEDIGTRPDESLKSMEAFAAIDPIGRKTVSDELAKATRAAGVALTEREIALLAKEASPLLEALAYSAP